MATVDIGYDEPDAPGLGVVVVVAAPDTMLIVPFRGFQTCPLVEAPRPPVVFALEEKMSENFCCTELKIDPENILAI
jgi:hypothetical protein